VGLLTVIATDTWAHAPHLLSMFFGKSGASPLLIFSYASGVPQ